MLVRLLDELTVLVLMLLPEGRRVHDGDVCGDSDNGPGSADTASAMSWVDEKEVVIFSPAVLTTL